MSADVGVVVLAYGDEPYLHEAVAAVLGSTGVEVEVWLVDNGCTTDAVATLPADPRLHVLRPAENLGFTGGANLGAQHVTAPVVAFVNSDAVCRPDALATLVAALADDSVGAVCAKIELADPPGTVNSVGNPLHVLGLSWAGHMGEPAQAFTTPHDVASVSGAAMALRRSTWDRLGGLPPEYFAYLEDLELSWRTWQHGLRVVCDPRAVVVHHYEFSRSPLKMYLVERNRLVFVATTYGLRLLLALLPVLVAFELAITLVATRQGWARQKLAGWRWVLTHLPAVARRRRLVQRTRRRPDRDLVHLMTATFDPAQLPLPPGSGVLQLALSAYWRLVQHLV